MQRIIRKQIRHTADGIDLAADIQAVVSINHGRASAQAFRGGDVDEQRVDDERDDRPSPEKGRTDD